MKRGAPLKCTVAPATLGEEGRLWGEMEMEGGKREAKDEREAVEAKRELNVEE